MANLRSLISRHGRSVPRAGAYATLALTCLAAAACTSAPTSHGGPTATSSGTSAATATAQPANTTGSGVNVLVYFSKHPDSDSNPDAVFPVSRVSPDLGVATYAVKQLIAGPTSSEAASGYYTPIVGIFSGASNCGGADFTIALNKKGSTPAQGTATLQFCRQTSLPGDLTGAYIKAELTKTLTQFATIQRVVILNISGACFDDLRGGNLCLS
ncbi:MAG TPA: GerMN domain-containing protein [Ktedonobacterales bacterium]|nr:GerMN domain-containing protein [Ktedonobacterales bacterium]